MFRPPAREMCLNTLEDVYQTCKLFHPAPETVCIALVTDKECIRRGVAPRSWQGPGQVETPGAACAC